MAIKGNNSANGLLILSTDTVLLNPVTGRANVTFASLHEQTGNSETLELFISPDATSVSGERLEKIIFAADETIQPISMLITIPDGQYLLAKATTGSRVECNLSYTQYTGAS